MENQKSGVRLIKVESQRRLTQVLTGVWWKSVWVLILSVSRGAKTGWVDHTQEFP